MSQFDDQHKKLVAMVNDLLDAVQGRRGKKTLGKILDGPVAYIKAHFAYEERHFQQHGYPDLAAHKAEHDALAGQVMEVQQKYHSRATATLSMEVINFLKNWLVKYIQGTDKKYGPFLNGEGVK